MTTNSKRIQKIYVTPAFRLSYPALFEPVADMNGKLKYGITMYFPKKDTAAALATSKHPAATWMPKDNLAAFWQEIMAVAKGNFGPDASPATLKLVNFRDGDKPKQNGKIEDNAKGYIVVRSTTDSKPQNLRGDKTPITDPSELYPGCWCRATLTIAPFLKPGHGVTIYLAGVQELVDDTAFSSRPRVEDTFDAVASGEGVVDTPAGGGMPWERNEL